jgi:hypothetical protein
MVSCCVLRGVIKVRGSKGKRKKKFQSANGRMVYKYKARSSWLPKNGSAYAQVALGSDEGAKRGPINRRSAMVTKRLARLFVQYRTTHPFFSQLPAGR